METTLLYEGESQLLSTDHENLIRFFPDLRRDDVDLSARIAEPIVFRDAMLALRKCIISELYVSTQEIIRRQQDPLITVTRERVFFEGFSTDESTYARVAVGPNAFDDVSKMREGCTNVNFTSNLATELARMRSTRPTSLEVRREGLTVKQKDRTHHEQKIDLPDSWMYGFLQVQSALRLCGAKFIMHPTEMRNLIVYLKRRKAKTSPRSLRILLRPGKAPQATLEPWGDVFTLERSQYDGQESQEIKVWGRRRLLLVEKIIPHTKRITVLLQGTGMPSFWIFDLGRISFLLGMSAWTARDWTHKESHHLFEASAEVTEPDLEIGKSFLHGRSRLTQADLAGELVVSREKANAILSHLCVQGHVLFDPETDTYYFRDVFAENPPESLPVGKREQDAQKLVLQSKVTLHDTKLESGTRIAQGAVQGSKGTYQTTCALDREGRIVAGSCECPFFRRYALQRGPCKHLLALRIIVRSSTKPAITERR